MYLLDLVTLEIVGPSSSHTAGVMRIGQKIKEAVPTMQKVKILLYNSLADTGDAHMTKSAIVAGLLGWKESDPRIPFSFSHAEDSNLNVQWRHRRDEHMHPNTLFAEVWDDKEKLHFFKGVSLGGGRFQMHKTTEIPQNHNAHNNHKNHHEA